MALSVILGKYNSNYFALKAKQAIFEYLTLLLVVLPIFVIINTYMQGAMPSAILGDGAWLAVYYEAFLSSLGARPIESY